MKSQRFPPLLRLSFPVPGSRSSTRAVGRGRGKSQGAAPGPGRSGRRQPFPQGPILAGQVATAAPTSAPAAPAGADPRQSYRDAWLRFFLIFFFFSRFLLLSPAARELSTSSYQARSHLLCNQSHHSRGSEGGGGGKETRALRLRRRRP